RSRPSPSTSRSPASRSRGATTRARTSSTPPSRCRPTPRRHPRSRRAAAAAARVQAPPRRVVDMATRLPRLPQLGPRARIVVRYLGFAALGLVSFVFAFQMTFPFDRVKDKAIDLLSEKYDVAIGGVERGFIPGRMYWKAVSIRTRPTKADEVSTMFYIEQLKVDLGLLALLRGTASVKLDAKFGPSHLTGHIALSKDGTAVEFRGDDLPSASLPMREALGLPMSGKIRLALDLNLPNGK